MLKEALVPKLTSISRRHTLNKHVLLFLQILAIFVGISIATALLVYLVMAANEEEKERENYVPNITIPSMDFTVLNITETSLSVKWDILIRIPRDLPGWYMCLRGDFKFLILYKGVTIATSSIESYNLIPWWAQLINISLMASTEDMDIVMMKDIMEDIKEIGDIRFGSRLALPDCRYGSRGKMNYACDEAMLRFDPDSQSNATLFGDLPICRYLR